MIAGNKENGSSQEWRQHYGSLKTSRKYVTPKNRFPAKAPREWTTEKTVKMLIMAEIHKAGAAP
jgi:hypothetical protein